MIDILETVRTAEQKGEKDHGRDHEPDEHVYLSRTRISSVRSPRLLFYCERSKRYEEEERTHHIKGYKVSKLLQKYLKDNQRCCSRFLPAGNCWVSVKDMLKSEVWNYCVKCLEMIWCYIDQMDLK